MEWNFRPNLPKHNELVIIIHRSLNVYACIFKCVNHETFGTLNLFVPIDDMRSFDNRYLDDSVNWYLDKFNYGHVYIECWLPYPKI